MFFLMHTVCGLPLMGVKRLIGFHNGWSSILSTEVVFFWCAKYDKVRGQQ